MTNHWPKQDPASMNAFYGCPDLNRDLRPDPEWERQNLVHITPPFPMVIAWDITNKVSTIAIHRKCGDSLMRILTRIGSEISQADADKFQINRLGGSYMFRPMRGAHALSIHSWAAAIDLSPELNAFGREYASRPNMMPDQVVRIFADEGWTWLGLARTPDAMHFQAAVL